MRENSAVGASTLDRFARQEAGGLRYEDRRLVDVTRAVLVDPNLHSDTRMSLAGEIGGLLRTAREDLHQAPLPAVHPARQPTSPAALADVLTDVLIDPHVRTDLRLRLHREISEALGRLSSLPV